MDVSASQMRLTLGELLSKDGSKKKRRLRQQRRMDRSREKNQVSPVSCQPKQRKKEAIPRRKGGQQYQMMPRSPGD